MRYFLIGLLVATSTVYAQPPTIEWTPRSPNPAGMPLDEAGDIRFQQVVQTPKTNRGQLIQRTGLWAAKFTGGTLTVITSDTSQGAIVIRSQLTLKQGAPINHQLVVEAKPGRYRATADEFAYQYEFQTPIKATKTYKLHPYGLSAQEWYDLYGMMGPPVGFSLAGIKKMAVKSADNQDAVLADIKQHVLAMLESLQKALTVESDW